MTGAGWHTFQPGSLPDSILQWPRSAFCRLDPDRKAGMARSNEGLKKPKPGKGLKSEPLHRRLTLPLHFLCPLNAALSHKRHRGHTGHTAHRAHTVHIAYLGHTAHTVVHAGQQDTQGTAEEMFFI